MFQFPSNGKVDSKTLNLPLRWQQICFNSLQTGKWIQRKNPRMVAIAREEYGFNSLQTGKWIQRLLKVPPCMLRAISGFNSLQTGKWIQRHLKEQTSRLMMGEKVSIPFKRESGFKVGLSDLNVFWAIRFQFPSNGKVDSKKSLLRTCGKKSEIKFQFPSNGKVDSKKVKSLPEVEVTPGFNSLQTGKWIQSTTCVRQPLGMEVSIPFKRESGFKGEYTHATTYVPTEFQFPSNGKVDSKFDPRDGNVKIAYRFNSLQTGKWIQSMNLTRRQAVSYRFNSLQTGKWIQSLAESKALFKAARTWFQFPSNGKVDSKLSWQTTRSPL